MSEKLVLDENLDVESLEKLRRARKKELEKLTDLNTEMNQKFKEKRTELQGYNRRIEEALQKKKRTGTAQPPSQRSQVLTSEEPQPGPSGSRTASGGASISSTGPASSVAGDVHGSVGAPVTINLSQSQAEFTQMLKNLPEKPKTSLEEVCQDFDYTD